jgi:SET domain-containing protein
MALTQSVAVEVRQVKGKGRGVFARRAIPEGEVIETCPMLVLPAEQVGDDPARHALAGYTFVWGRGTVALALGYGSLYNHSYQPNARYEDVGGRTKRFVALRDIAAGEEITVNYNGEPGDRSPVWFDVTEGKTTPRVSGSVGGAGSASGEGYGVRRSGPSDDVPARIASFAQASSSFASSSTPGGTS